MNNFVYTTRRSPGAACTAGRFSIVAVPIVAVPIFGLLSVTVLGRVGGALAHTLLPGGDIFNGGGTSRRRPWGGDLLLGHGEDELALGAVRHGRLDDVADAGRRQLEIARVDKRRERPGLHELGERPQRRSPKNETWDQKGVT